MLKHCLQDEINKQVIGYITWIVFINIALWRIRGDDDDFGMDEGDECDYIYIMSIKMKKFIIGKKY